MSRDAEAQTAEALGQMYLERAGELLSLAFLLTGNSDATVEAVTEAVTIDDAQNPFFGGWMAAWARRLVIANALEMVRSQLASSIKRFQKLHRGVPPADDYLPPAAWTAGQDISRAQMEQSILAIDIFPRCVLLLRRFERMSLEQAAILLNTGKDMVKVAETAALVELARNVAREQGWRPAQTRKTFCSQRA